MPTRSSSDGITFRVDAVCFKMFDVANHVFATVAGHLQPNVTKQRHRYYYLFYFILFFDPGTQFPGNEKNYAMQYKKSTKIKLE